MACFRKSLSIIELLLQCRCSTNIPNNKGETAQDIPLNEDGDYQLNIACQWGDVDIVRYLLSDEKCNLNVQSCTSENTPLHIALWYGQDDVTVELLSCKKFDVNIQNKEGDTPLHIAVKQNRTAAISQLSAHQQCNVNVQNKVGDTPLHSALKYGEDDTPVQLLSYKKGDLTTQNNEGDTPLHVAVRHNKTAAVSQLLVHQQCNINTQNKDGNTPLHIAVRYRGWYGQDDILCQLLSCKECNLNIQNKKGDTPLHIAVKQNKTAAILELLTLQQCNVNIQNGVGDTPLHTAVKQNKIAPASQLLATKRCDLNIQNVDTDTPLHIAVRQAQDGTIIELLCCKECNPNTKNREGDTPLHIACYRRSIDIIILFLEMRCSTTIPNKKGETAQDIPLNEDGDCLLHLACQWGDASIVRYLVTEESCDPNIRSYNSENTPLHIAVMYWQDDTIIAQLLSCKESDITAQNNEDDTPLHVAVRHNQAAAVSRLLVHQQCNINTQNKDGNTPLHIAVRYRGWYGQDNILCQLLSCKECNLNIQNKKGDTPLHIAVKQNKTAAILELLTLQQCNVNIQNGVGDTPLHTAVKIAPVFQILATKRCDLNIQNVDTDTPLHIAVRQAQDDTIFELLCCKECNPNTKNREGDTPLHIACYRRSVDIIILFLEMRCNTNIPNKNGETAQGIPLNEDGDCLLHIACLWGDVDIVEYIFCHQTCDRNIQNTYLNTPLHHACYQKFSSIIRFLLKMRCSITLPNKKGEAAQDIPLDEDENCLLHLACQWGDMDTVEYLIADQRCALNIKNAYWNTPLHIACYMKSLRTIKLLLEMRCSTTIPNKKGETAQDIPLNEDGDHLLHLACQWGDASIVRYLVTEESCDPNVQSYNSDNTPLHIAVIYGQDDTIAQLLSYEECNPNNLNKEGNAPLHIARKTTAVSQLLAHQQCNINAQNKVSDTPIHIAITYGENDTIAQLLSKKECNPNVQTKEGDTPLHIAVRENMTAAISQLLTHQQCNPNIKNKVGDTPLHIACYMKSLRTIKLLLEMRCSTTIPNKKGETAQDIPLNEDGDRLLHLACQWGDASIVRYLVTEESCDPNVQSYNSDNTPLHIAVIYGQDDTIAQLLSYEECNPNNLNKEGNAPLHIARKTTAVSQLLAHQQCNINAQNKVSDTPIHIAITYGENDTIAQLLSKKECNPNVQTKEGDTPLHIAVRENMTAAISQLLTHQQCNPNIKNKVGDTPLHIAVRSTNNNTLVQLLSCLECDPNVPNKEGDAPLHLALQLNKPAMISQLLVHQQCNINVQNKLGDTPIHVAVKENNTTPLSQQRDSISQLLSCEGCDLNIQNKEGDTPLHIAVRDNITPAITQLLSNRQHNPNVQEKEGNTALHIIAKAVDTVNSSKYDLLVTDARCDLNIMNSDHCTPLLTAIKHNNHTLATALLQHNKCDPTLCDLHGNTALHLACKGGETQPEMVEIAKTLLTSVDPSCVNNTGQTPIELTTNYQLIQAISHLVKCKTKQSVQTYINLFIVGNPETGKSTLVKAICKEAGMLWKLLPKKVRRVKNVPPHTAGIIPTTFRSKTFGNTVLYDLAGQIEYYTSHAAVIQSTVISTPPAFVVVVNLSESEEKISQTLRYWCSFIDIHAEQSSAPPEVILVGSHADVVKSTGKSVQEKLSQISTLLKQVRTSFHFAGHVALDCRDPVSRNLQLFCSIVNQSCTVLRQTADVDLHCHVLYAFLLEKFKGKVACRVSDVATSVKETSALLPQNSDSLIPLISTLSDKGLLFLVKSGEGYGNW